MLKENLINKKINRLLVIEKSPTRNNKTFWLCRCDCGNEKIISAYKIKSGHTKSCGCLLKENRTISANLMIKVRTKYHPKIAVAKRVWRHLYKDVLFEDFYKLSQLNCYYCDSFPSNKQTLSKEPNRSKFAMENGIFIYNGLDRLDSNKSHTIDNVVTSCFICNRAKRERTLDQFTDHTNNLIKYYNSRNVETYRSLSHSISIEPIKITKLNPYKTSVNIKLRSSYSDGNLSLEQFYQLSQLNCFYCNAQPSNLMNYCNGNALKETKNSSNFYYSGLDRIDSKLNHSYDNVIPCCKYCNYAKHKLTLFEFGEWIQKLKKKKAEYNARLL